MSKILFFIPARGGSKGLPGKNIKKLCGFPMLYWSVKAAKDSGIPGDIVVSTDSKKIADVAKKFGAEVPFLRPPQLAQDHVATMDVIKHFFEWCKNQEKKYETIIILQPTSPLRTGEDILKAYNDFKKRKCDSVISVVKTSFNPAWINTLPSSMSMKGFLPSSVANKNRQQHKQFYEINGAVYVARFEKIVKLGRIYTSNTFAYEMPSSRSIDVDTEEDFIVAQYFLKKRLSGK